MNPLKTFTIPGKPQAKERPRTVNGHTYTPNRTKDYEELVRLYAREARVQCIDTGPVKVTITWAKQVPQSWSKKRRAAALAGVWAVDRMDLDNVAKSVLDSLNRIAYTDDSQVAMLSVSRLYVEQPDTVTVTISQDWS